jgi:hypothetical protein
VFILYALLVGLVVGALTGGRPARLGSLGIRWPWVIAGGFAAQVILFSEPVTRVVGDAGPPLYVLSTLVVLTGAVSNMVAIVANGGYMPTTAEALQALGKLPPETYSNSSVPAAPVLWPLTDIFAMPAWLPFANVFSIGDVLIGLGIAIAVVSTMHRPDADPSTLGSAAPPKALVP